MKVHEGMKGSLLFLKKYLLFKWNILERNLFKKFFNESKKATRKNINIFIKIYFSICKYKGEFYFVAYVTRCIRENSSL